MPTRHSQHHLDRGTAPRLRTLGLLALPGGAITRPKPLLLLAYLAHEGPTDRDRLARLFFSASLDARDALSTTLRRLGGLVERCGPRDARIVTALTTDAQDFQRGAVELQPEAALSRYTGPFMQGLSLPAASEVEEWIVTTRERLASMARDLHLAVARTELRRRRALPAWRHTSAAVGLTEAFALDPSGTADVLAQVGHAGLPVPDGWWHASTESGPAAASRRPRPTIGQGVHQHHAVSRLRSSRLNRFRKSRTSDELS